MDVKQLIMECDTKLNNSRDLWEKTYQEEVKRELIRIGQEAYRNLGDNQVLVLRMNSGYKYDDICLNPDGTVESRLWNGAYTITKQNFERYVAKSIQSQEDAFRLNSALTEENIVLDTTKN